MSLPSADQPAVRVTQIGSWPGTNIESVIRLGWEETPDLPVLPELPGRGAMAQMIGRTTALLSGLEVDLQPAGWRLIHGSARDHRRAQQLLRDDLERLEEQAQEWSGPMKCAFAGPWTMAAQLELPMGEKVLADHGAQREVAASLAEGVREFRAELARRLPHVTCVVQLDEPMLSVVARGQVRTASGYRSYAAIDEPEFVEPYKGFLASGQTWLHSCAGDLPWSWLAGLADLGLAIDESLVDHHGWDILGELLEQGRTVALGMIGASVPGGRARPRGSDQIAHQVLRRIESWGLGPEIVDQLWLTPACGLAGETERDAVRMLRDLRAAAGIVTEELTGE